MRHENTSRCCVLYKMEEDEVMRRYCRTMISRVQNKQQHLQFSGDKERRRRKHKESRGRERAETGGHAAAGDELRENNLVPQDCTQQQSHQSCLCLMCQGPKVQPVPLQLISTLRLKVLEERMRQAADVELHDPTACSACEQEQAFLALRSFIWRKKTQLQFQTLKSRLNTCLIHRDCTSLCTVSTEFGRDYLEKICGSQQPGVALATTKERGVAPATDEMRGHPDKSATGTHLARPLCPFPDR